MGLWFQFYKDSLEDRLLSDVEDTVLGIIKDIVVGSQMSVPQNVLKVLGCCLETKNPIIVYEFAEDRNLYNFICILLEYFYKNLIIHSWLNAYQLQIL